MRRAFIVLLLVSLPLFPHASAQRASAPPHEFLVAHVQNGALQIALGQSLIQISPQQCIWRAGDDIHWAAPVLDESNWLPYTKWKSNPREPHIWIRCDADLAPLRAASHPALQVRLYAAYQVYVDGVQIGRAGDLRGDFSMNIVRSFPLPQALPRSVTVALRVTYRFFGRVPAGVLPPLNLNVADGAILRDRHANVVLAQSSARLANVLCFGIVGVIGFVLLGLFLFDRARRVLLYLSVECLAVALIYINWFGAAALVDYSAIAFAVLWATPAFAGNIARTLFFFKLAGRRVPLLFWILIGLGDSLYLVVGTWAFLPPRQALWLDAARVYRIEAVCTMALVAVAVAPFVAFFPYSRVSKRMRPLAGLSMAWGLVMVLFFFVRMTAFHIPGLPNLQEQWGVAVATAEGVSTLCLLVALLGLLFREQQQQAQERALLAGEMQAARSVQSLLVPVTAPNTPGFTVESVYLPASEVGGDFFQIQPGDDGSLLIVVGDVSGKGLKAAMTVSTIIGALRNEPSRQPAEILDHLNRVLHGQIKGFATCCAALITNDGRMAIANAGHIPPYLNGDELRIENGLPLGVVAAGDYGEMSFHLAADDRLTLVSDGVVEATNTKRELFGFERTQAISDRDANSIAQAAQSFGQVDDISVLTVQVLASVPA